MKRRSAWLLLCPLLLLSACGKGESAPAPAPTPAPTAEAEVEPSLDYVSLGDSIAWGYGLDDPESQCYCYVLGEKLAASGQTVKVWRDGVNGDASGDLRELLAGGRAKGLEEAELITVSIGANNVLLPAVSFLGDYAAYEQGSAAMTAAGVSESFSGFLTAADAGVAALREDIPAIISLIRQANRDATIVWLTVYNPYRGTGASFTVGGLPIQFEALTETKISLMNETIAALAEENGYLTADVYTAFAADGGALVNAAEGTALFAFLLDPHPNAAGHRLIAQTIWEALP